MDIFCICVRAVWIRHACARFVFEPCGVVVLLRARFVGDEGASFVSSFWLPLVRGGDAKLRALSRGFWSPVLRHYLQSYPSYFQELFRRMVDPLARSKVDGFSL